MRAEIPDDQWQPLTVAEVVSIFANAPFQWALAGGYAIEQFLGSRIRAHGDIDVVVFRDDQLRVQKWLDGWELYAADPPGSLRKWIEDEYLPVGIHDIWGHQTGLAAWQLQLMLSEVEGDAWFSRRDSRIRGPRHDLFVEYDDIPCIRIEVQLLYKAKNLRPKDEIDFRACLSRLNPKARQWLKDNLSLIYPQGHPWLNRL